MSNSPYPSGLTTFINDIQARLQCNNNDGYCGEASMISAGLYYGQYLSQYDVREIASAFVSPKIAPGKDQGPDAQLLLGTKKSPATAKALRLTHEKYNSKDSEKFLAWVKKHVAQGHPVIIGVFNNENMLYNNKNKKAGDNEYDHIVPVFGNGSPDASSFGSSTTPATYHPLDIIMFSDNGLYTQVASPLGYNTRDQLQGYIDQYQYFFTMDTDASANPDTYNFLLGRKDANNTEGNIYSLLNLPPCQVETSNSNYPLKNYGIAITGIEGRAGETFPVRIITNPDSETDIGSGGETKPKGISMTLSITVSGLTHGENYNLYRYGNYKNVPTSDFNKKSTGVTPTVITPQAPDFTSWSGTVNIKSDQQAFFRAVKANKQ